MAALLYGALPKTSHVPTEVALSAATVKTVVQVATPSTREIVVFGWGISFDGASASAEPVVCTLNDVDVAATVTSLTPEAWGSSASPASLCPGGTSATGYNASAEGSITASRMLDHQNVHPQTGYSVWFPADSRPRIAVSRFLRLRANAPAAVNALGWIVWQE